jgi:hypothetical protein
MQTSKRKRKKFSNLANKYKKINKPKKNYYQVVTMFHVVQHKVPKIITTNDV